MDIYWHGQACFKLKGKQTTVIIDPFVQDFTGLKLPKDLDAQIAVSTHNHDDHNNIDAVTGDPVKVAGPGEYEIKGVAITGVQTYHDKNNGEERGKNTVYNMQVDGVNVVHLGDLGHLLSQEQIESIDRCDVLLIPVGGVYTIAAEDAAEVISQLEPSIVIPMHYNLLGLKFELDPVENFLKEMGVENAQPQSKLTITREKLPSETQVVVLSKA